MAGRECPQLTRTCGDDSLLEVYTKTVQDSDNKEEEKEDKDNDEKKDVAMDETDQ